MHYTHLAEEERYYLCHALKSGKSMRAVAKEIGRNVSTVSRELARNKGLRGYRYKQADAKSSERQACKGQKRISAGTWLEVEQRLLLDNSPEQISGALALQGIRVSHEWIYQHILVDKRNGGSLYTHLRCQRKRKRRYGRPDKRGQMKDRVSIDLRPKIVDERSRLGDWEADCVEGSKGGPVLVTLAERKSRLMLAGKAENKSASEVSRVILELLTPIKDYVHTITYDNGKEFSYHAAVSDKLEAQGFFAHPYTHGNAV
jgi:transposase, IS30 family